MSSCQGQCVLIDQDYYVVKRNLCTQLPSIWMVELWLRRTHIKPPRTVSLDRIFGGLSSYRAVRNAVRLEYVRTHPNYKLVGRHVRPIDS